MANLQGFIDGLTSEETEQLFTLLLQDLNIEQVGRLLNEELGPTDAAELIAQPED
jgi:hypothetical protein